MSPQKALAFAILGIVLVLGMIGITVATGGIGSRPAKSVPAIKELPAKKVPA